MAEGRPVYVNVYDLASLNDRIHRFGLGIFHSGIEVDGIEFCYGGHPYDSPGIFQVTPKQMPDIVFRESIQLGETFLSRREIKEVVSEMGTAFTGVHYHLLTKNCNHFSSEFAERLCGRPTPRYINRMAHLGVMFPCFVPRDWLAPPTMPVDDDDEDDVITSEGSSHASPSDSEPISFHQALRSDSDQLTIQQALRGYPS